LGQTLKLFPEKLFRSQQLTNEAYGKWQYSNDWTLQDFRNYIKENLTQQHLIAVQITNLHYQVKDGGFFRWYSNGYSIDLEDLILYCKEIGTEAAIKVKALLEFVADIICFFDDKFDSVMELLYENIFNDCVNLLVNCLEQKMTGQLKQYDRQYYKISDKFLSDVEEYLVQQKTC